METAEEWAGLELEVLPFLEEWVGLELASVVEQEEGSKVV